jgi:thioredoxin 1
MEYARQFSTFIPEYREKIQIPGNWNRSIPSYSIITILVITYIIGCMSMSGNTIEITDGTFNDILQDNSSVVVDCWAPWCGPCRMIGPVIDQLSEEYEAVKFGKLNTDENIEISRKFQIMAIPTLLFFKNGELVDRITGVVPKGHIEDVLKKHM